MDQGPRTIQEHLPPAMPAFDVLHQGQGDLLLIALLCALSVLLILLWWLAVSEYMCRTNMRSSESRRRSRIVCRSPAGPDLHEPFVEIV